MKQGLLIFLVICASAIAMVPRDRRAVSTDEKAPKSSSKDSKICAQTTPCGWSIYKPKSVKIREINVTNTYCACGPGTTCQDYENDSSINAYVQRCLPEGEKKNVTES